MATYNGARFVKRQLESILIQLDQNDQIIVVDDASTDNTTQIIESLKDSRINMHKNTKNMGVVSTFDRALHLAQGDFIFLSDQDDRWLENKVSTVCGIFDSQNIDLIVHNGFLIEENQTKFRSLFEVCNNSSGVIKNIVSNTYTGCCMAFRREILKKVLPIPAKRGIFHDAWIGIIAEFYGNKISFVDAPLIEWNRHGGNVSTLKRRKLTLIFTERIILILAIVNRIIRVYFKNDHVSSK